MFWLAGNVAVTRHVAVTVVLDVAVDHLVQGPECGDVGVGVLVYHQDLNSWAGGLIVFLQVSWISFFQRTFLSFDKRRESFNATVNSDCEDVKKPPNWPPMFSPQFNF